jgi:hypothetical protein
VGSSVQQTSDGGYIITGYTDLFGTGNNDAYLIKTDASGDTLWTKSYGGSGLDEMNSVQQTSDGGYILAGRTSSFGAGWWDAYLIKTDSAGNVLWTRTYGGTNDDDARSVQQTTTGGYIVLGGTQSFGHGGWDAYLIRADSNGDTLWTRTYGGTDLDAGNSVQQTSEGGYILAGTSYSFGAGNGDVYLIKTDSSGNVLWTKTYGGTNYDGASSVQQTSDGGYIIAGSTGTFPSLDIYLIKTNASGDTLWTKTYGGTGRDEGHSIQQTSDRGYVLTGHTNSFGAGGHDAYLIKMNSFGDTLWTKTYGGGESDWANSVQQTLDGGYILTGGTCSFGDISGDVYLIKTDGEGISGMNDFSPCPAKSQTFVLSVRPNPFTSFTTLPGHYSTRFALYDISGRRVGTYKGDRIGADVPQGVYFLRPEDGNGKPARIVKVR